MSLYIEQKFPLGRFHATRWKQGAYGDPYGEWPPSPWRLLRAIANRWFQWSRETGDYNKERLDNLLQTLSSHIPEFYITPHSCQGEPIKQYQPVGLEEKYKYKKDSETKKQVLDYQYRMISTTLSQDNYRLVPPESSLFWLWPEINKIDHQLLDALLERILYFGRAESWTKIRRLDKLPGNPGEHCILLEKRTTNSVPVLAADPKHPDNLDYLFTTTEHEDIKNRDIPPGTRWFYTNLPAKPRIAIKPRNSFRYPKDLTCIQFVIGGRILPTMEHWPVVTNKFRNHILAKMTENRGYSSVKLSIETRDKIKGISGKDSNGQVLKDHSHAYFAIIPDEQGQPSRLIAWRSTPFNQDEITAMMSASEKPIIWDNAALEWKLKLLPLPFSVGYSPSISKSSQCWKSITPFVPPRQRRRYRKNGKHRLGESPDKIIQKLLYKVYGVTAASIDVGEMSWVLGHVNYGERKAKSHRIVLPGYCLTLHFNKPISGPIALGDSCHFGLGLFAPVRS